ncbi:hypothetical protein EYF80_018185 [Liparis tanakae]|uniref:Uncharacterized protein n=1 Tax=Liparis tanakae TaxID=230148 RepID=A0A4Z2I1G6_9TELE|nr:hypothetical protein EYF80_018185 [Liparis tanakae]
MHRWRGRGGLLNEAFKNTSKDSNEPSESRVPIRDGNDCGCLECSPSYCPGVELRDLGRENRRERESHRGSSGGERQTLGGSSTRRDAENA